MFRMFLIKYAEIGVKGKNRYLFEDALIAQIKRTLRRVEGRFSVTKESGRIYVEAVTEFDFDETGLQDCRYRRTEAAWLFRLFPVAYRPDPE